VRVRRAGVILFGSPLGLMLVARNARACSCAGATGAKTLREVAERCSDGPNASKIVLKVQWKRGKEWSVVGMLRDATS
jgi:hypothetical protein